MAGTELASAYISLFPKLKTNEIEAQLKGVKVDGAGTSAGKSYGDMFGKAFKAIAGAVVIKELAQGFGTLTKSAVDAFATFEQLEGGVQKIFDQMDNARIFDDASRAFFELNMSANEYLEVINQTGAAFASTMGDEAGYQTARQGLLAISDYASGTGRNLDELKEKFTLITRSTSSYQSIADQFSGVLPATSQGFLEQAQAAGILSDEYTKLTEVPIDEYQQAVTAMLEQGVEDLGLAGNTAAETANTISGSLAGLTAAWNDWLAGLANDNADIQALTNQLIDMLIVAASNIAPRILQIVGSLGETLKTQLPVLLDELIASISSGGVNMGTAAVEFFGSILTALIQATPQILAALGLLLASLVVALGNKVGEMVTKGLELMKGVASGIGSGASFVVSEIGRGISEGVARIKSGVGSFVQAGRDLVAGMARGVSNAAGEVWNAIKRICSNALGAIKSFFGISSPSKVMREMFGYVGEGMVLGLNDKAASVVGAMQGIANDTMAAASFSASPSLATAGAGAGAGSTNIILNCDIKDLQGIQTLNDLYDMLVRARAINPTRR